MFKLFISFLSFSSFPASGPHQHHHCCSALSPPPPPRVYSSHYPANPNVILAFIYCEKSTFRKHVIISPSPLPRSKLTQLITECQFSFEEMLCTYQVGDGINRNWSEWAGWPGGWGWHWVAGRQASAMTPYSLSVRLSLPALKLQSGICFCSKMVCSHTTCFQNIKNNKNLNEHWTDSQIPRTHALALSLVGIGLYELG